MGKLKRKNKVKELGRQVEILNRVLRAGLGGSVLLEQRFRVGREEPCRYLEEKVFQKHRPQ